MSCFVGAIHLEGGSSHEHVARLVWMHGETGKSGIYPTADLVKWIQDGNQLYVGDGKTKTRVGVVELTGKKAYLRTYADKSWTNNLLELPRF